VKPLLVLAALLLAAAAPQVFGRAPVGERHLKGAEPSAALRDADHKSDVRVTVWYPAAAGVKEERIDLGPPGKPLFIVEQIAYDAPFVDARKRPVILFSHGFGGTARMMGWYGVPLARAGYVVVAVDHPGNNGMDRMTTPGAILSWDRAKDLRAALEAVKADPQIAPHLDLKRLGVTGFSAGGFTSLVSAGATVDMNRFIAFCRRNPTDGVVRPAEGIQADHGRRPEGDGGAGAGRRGGARRRRPHDPGREGRLRHRPGHRPGPAARRPGEDEGPGGDLLGDADPVAPPATNGLVAAKAIPHAELTVLPGVKHYDFLSTCTDAGRAGRRHLQGRTAPGPDAMTRRSRRPWPSSARRWASPRFGAARRFR
jgi:predicted dienelactone hydrolase